MAMCFSLAAFGPLPVRINEPGCVAKTFLEYFSVLAGAAVSGHSRRPVAGAGHRVPACAPEMAETPDAPRSRRSQNLSKK